MPMRPGYLTLIWILITLGIAVYLAFGISGQNKRVFLPGKTTDGHYQIEIACTTCHTPFGGVRQAACLDCHQADLETAGDSHPEKKFADPRNASDLARLDVRQCITCHTEHRPEITAAMGVTLPEDFCYHCHADVAEERPTHRGMSFDTCTSAGCHNYHDNRALYEDFLVLHGDAGADTFEGELPPRETYISQEDMPRLSLTAEDADGPIPSMHELIAAWAGSAHAAAGIACSTCHQDDGSAWTDQPPFQVCGSCHELEPEGFLAGKHGMRLAVDLDPMSPSMARLPMQQDALSRMLACGSCHDVHAVDVRHAAVDACLACHADEHSLAYSDSPHFRLWQTEVSGEGKPGSGVSCASCHLPRERHRVSGEVRTVVQHNQNANLRPNEKMIREVCLNCHSLRLSIDALADRELIRNNFVGLPVRHVQSIDMALSRKE